MIDESHYDLRQVHQWTGHSEQMIDYLCRTGIVTPVEPGRRGRGRMRKFKFADIVLLRTVKLLLDQGVSVKKISASLQNIREKFEEFTPGQLPNHYIFSDGQNVYLKIKKDVLAEISKSNQLAFSFIMHLPALQKDIDKRTPKSVKEAS
ncbi:MAG: MerR family transcriptional regulator [Parvibaculum sp.]